MTSGASDRSTLPLILLTLGLTIVAAMPLFLTGALAVQMREELGFGVAALGMAVAAFRFVGAVTAPRLGSIVDRVGPVPAMRAAIAVSVIASLGIALFARSWGSLVAFLAFGGSANALAQTGSNISLVRAVRDGRQGIAFALKQSALPAASALSGLAVPLLAIRFGWRYAFVLAAVAAGALLFALPSTGDVRFKPKASAPGAAAPTTRPLLVLTLGVFFAMSAATTLSTFTVDSAVAAGISAGRAGLLLTLGSLLAIVTRLVVGAVADRRQGGSLRTVAYLIFGGTLGYLVLAMQSSWTIPVGIALAFGLGWGFNGLFWYAIVRLHREKPGAATGKAMSGGLVGGLLGPTIFGWVVEASSYRMAWGVAALWAALGGIAMLWGRHLVLQARAAG